MKRRTLLGAAIPMLAATSGFGAASSKKAAPKKHSVARDPYLGAIVVESPSGRVLFEDHADALGHPASVLKLMLMLITMEQMKSGILTLRDPVTVSRRAVGIEGANLDLREGESFPLEDMLYALMIHSANDVAVAVAEKLAGTVEAYVTLINRRARELGMSHSEFHSPNGLGPKDGEPYDDTTARDIALLSLELMKHPEVLRFTSAMEHDFRPNGGKRRVQMKTHNYLLDELKGCDGLKTGYIAAAGYCISATAMRKDRRIIAVILGATSEESRNKIAKRLIEKGFSS